MKKALCILITFLMIVSFLSLTTGAKVDDDYSAEAYAFRGKLTDARSLTEEEAEILEEAAPSSPEWVLKICATDLLMLFSTGLPLEDSAQIVPSRMVYLLGGTVMTSGGTRQELRGYCIRLDKKAYYEFGHTEYSEFFIDRIDHVEALLKNNGVDAELKSVYCLENFYGRVMMYFVTEQGDYILFNPYYCSSAYVGEIPDISKEYFFPAEVMYEIAAAWQAEVHAANERAKETGVAESWGGEITDLKDLSAYVVAPETWVLASTEKEGTDPSENTDVSTETGTDASAAQTEKTTGAAEDGSKTGWIVAAVCAGVVVIAVIAAVLLRKKKD